MIKFNCLIYKPTGLVIKYDQWFKRFRNNEPIDVKCPNKFTGQTYYGASDIIFMDDFEIIYDSELTYKELSDLYRSTNNKELGKKVSGILNKKEELIQKYDLDL